MLILKHPFFLTYVVYEEEAEVNGYLYQPARGGQEAQKRPTLTNYVQFVKIVNFMLTNY